MTSRYFDKENGWGTIMMMDEESFIVQWDKAQDCYSQIGW